MRLLDAQSLASELMAEHLDESWLFGFDSGVTRFGCCRIFYRDGNVVKKISLSEPYVLLNNKPIVKEVTLHEIAHAIVGPEKGHSEEWKQCCKEIGCKPERLVKHPSLVHPKPKYTGRCQSCGTEFHHHRLRKNREYVCPTCETTINFVKNF